jgi:orotidine-5'-phosphate decarboxylase
VLDAPIPNAQAARRPLGGKSRLIAAIDTPDLARARTLATVLGAEVGLLKLGLEFFVANGPDAVRAVAASSPGIFLDLKLHDIPNTVAGAVRAACRVSPAMLTLHAAGGARMLEAAREAAEVAGGAARPMLLAVTVLTSIDAATLVATGAGSDVAAQVLRLARLALASGVDGLVCSPAEARLIRDALGDALALVVPGIRPEGHAASDQARIATPAQAVAAGADWIVVGRPITEAPDPTAAARAIAASL